MSVASRAILSNFFEEQCTQNHPQYLSGLSRAHFPTTFLETAVSLTIISFTGTYEPTTDLLPTSVASVGRASQRHRDVTGSNPVEVLNFFQASVRNCINCVHCDDHFFIFIYDHNVVQEKHNFRSLQTVCKELAHAIFSNFPASISLRLFPRLFLIKDYSMRC